MDIFAHGLWAVALYKAVNLYQKTKFKLLWAAFWGVFPDVFAFSIPMGLHAYNLLMKGASMYEHPLSELTHIMYSMSHSAIIFFLFFLTVCLICKHYHKPKPWILGGWLLHTLCDVPTHSYRFFPTPVFWPLSEWKFNGISWGTPWFMMVNYTAIVTVYLLLARKANEKNRKTKKNNISKK
ncbi:MAG TPA: metal-dependent hydrolase [Candidatus Nanoarchaeia archaeon]|nr:metal-dependent hydrolase [Candidatus Nanoarchaeia archaeon]